MKGLQKSHLKFENSTIIEGGKAHFERQKWSKMAYFEIDLQTAHENEKRVLESRKVVVQKTA